MHRAETDVDAVRCGIAFAEFVQGEVNVLPQEHLQEQFAFLGDPPGASHGAGLGRELPRLNKELLEALNGGRADMKYGRRVPNRVVEGMVKQPGSKIQ